MTTIINLYVTAFFFLVVFGALGIVFSNWISKKIPSSPGETKGADNETKMLD